MEEEEEEEEEEEGFSIGAAIEWVGWLSLLRILESMERHYFHRLAANASAMVFAGRKKEMLKT